MRSADQNEPPVVDFYFGVGSRYSYLAASQLDRIAVKTGARFRWRPVSSPDLFLEGRNPFQGAPVSGQYDWAYRRADAEAWAAYYEIPFIEPHGRLAIDARLLARAAIAGGRMGKLEAMSRRLMAAVYAEARTVLGTGDLAMRATDVGIDAAQFLIFLEDSETEASRQALVAEARGRGVFGVPTFFLGDQRFFGNDRLVLLEHALRQPAGA